MKSYPLRILMLYLTAALLAACGGGGGGKLGNPGGGGNDWEPGVFLDADTFFNQCQSPVGTDPFTNQAYGAGSTLDENNFLRSFSNDTYLWYDEVPDQDPGLFNNTLDYFAELRTSGLSPSGAAKDKFHFTYTTDEWFDLSQGGVSAGYGIDWAFISAVPPRDIRIAYTEPNSPAASAGLTRGDRVLSINGFDIDTNSQTGIDVLNAAFYPDGLGETYTFTFSSGTVQLTSELITNAMVQNVKVIDLPGGGRVGYLTFNYHRAPAEEELFNAIEFLDGQGIDDLVLDIRYNGGGFLDIAAQLAYMIAGPVPTAGRTFESLQFNDKHPITNPITGNPITPTPFHDETLGFSLAPGQALPSLELPRVFVLTGGGTCSASEAVMNGLRGVGVEVIQIGSRTCGKPYGFYPQGNCGTHYFTIQFRGVNEASFGDYTDGFYPGDAGSADLAEVPGCSVADDFTKQLGDPTEGQLAMALAYRETGACPAPATAAAESGLSKADTPLSSTDGVVHRSPWDSNRIMLR